MPIKHKIPSEFKILRVRECASSYPCDSGQKIYDYWQGNIPQADWHDADREHLVVLLHNTRLNPIGHHLISVGTSQECLCHPREVLRPAIIHAAYGFTLMHDHPSGDPTPSASDHRITKRLRDASDIMQINFIDHLIIGRDQTPFFSFREAGIL